MTMEEVLQLLVKAPSLDRKQMGAVKSALLSHAKRFDSMQWVEQQGFKDAYDASLRLLVVRLSDGRDNDPCAGLKTLVTKAPFGGVGDGARYQWIAENASPMAHSVDARSDTNPARQAISKRALTELAFVWAAARTAHLRMLADTLESKLPG